MKKSVYRQAFHYSIPICCGFLPVAITFGVLFTKQGFPWYYAPLSGLVIFAGTAQLVSVELMAIGTSPLALFVAVFVMNLRHLFYGPSFIQRYHNIKPIHRAYLIFGLCDETFATLMTKRYSNQKEDRLFCTLVTFLNHLWWTLGCLIGGYLGSRISVDIKGIGFTLTALLIVLLVEQVMQRKRRTPFLLAFVTGSLGILIYPKQMLMISLTLVLITLLVFTLVERSFLRIRVIRRRRRHYGH